MTAQVGVHALWRAGSGGGGGRWRELPGWLIVPLAFGAGAVPFSNLAAKILRGVDLRTVGTGTVSGTGLYRVAGVGPLVAAGLLEVAKGAVGPALCGPGRPRMAAFASAAAVAGHNWSPFLRGAGGRGISPAIGALLVTSPAGSAALLGGMAAGRMAGETALGSLAGDLVAVVLSRRLHGAEAGMVAVAVLVPMVAKRLAGNRRAPSGSRTYLWRLIFDRDCSRPGESLLGASSVPSGLKLSAGARP